MKLEICHDRSRLIRRIVYYSALTGILAWQGCASTPAPVHRPIYQPSGPTSVTLPAGYGTTHTIRHEVGPLETLWRISKMYNVDMETIMRVNNISDPSKITMGQVLEIPHTTGPVPVIPLYPSHKWSYIVIHHTATETGNAKSINDLHYKRGFWNGLGYHFLIDNGTDGKLDGQIEVGPRWIQQRDGAHANADGMNQRGIGISLVGNYSEERVSAKELESLLFLVKTLQRYYNIPDAHVIRHKDVRGKHTECPGNNFPWAEFKSRLASS